MAIFKGCHSRARTELENEGQVGTASGIEEGKSLKAEQVAWCGNRAEVQAEALKHAEELRARGLQALSKVIRIQQGRCTYWGS